MTTKSIAKLDNHFSKRTAIKVIEGAWSIREVVGGVNHGSNLVRFHECEQVSRVFLRAYADALDADGRADYRGTEMVTCC